MKCAHKMLVAVLVCVFSLSALGYDITLVGTYHGDLNSDGMVDYNDLFILAGQWLQAPSDPNADIAPAGGDGIVNFLDFAVLAKDWGGNYAMAAAQSGYECGISIVTNSDANAAFQSTGDNVITQAQADDTWNKFCLYIHNNPPAGKTVSATPTSFTDAHGSGTQLVVPVISCSTGNVSFILRFYRYTYAGSDANTIKCESTGTCGSISRKITINLKIQKSADVLKYAIVSKPRVWITGDSTIHGNIYSSWKYQTFSPFNMTSDSNVLGTINTILTNINPITGKSSRDLYAGTTKMPYDLETLDNNGNPVYDTQGNKIISPTDEIQGQCQSINYNVNYGEKATNMPGMDLSDYDTSTYKNQTIAPADSTIYNYNRGSHGNPTTPATITEYFPHAVDSSGNPLYGQQSSSGSLKLTRYVCQNKTLTNLRVAVNKNVLFQNCTFNGILYVDGGTLTSNSNNIRFANCVFNGPIVTTPSTDTSSGWWQRNCLYFTGTETFQNNTTVPATILAPNFNVNLGNIDPTNQDNNVLTGAIVGGIVDIRGNAQIYGTIISMSDTSMYSSGFVSNIGATLGDGGSETTEPGDVGIIDITPNPNQLLPSGITTPIVIMPLQSTYRE